MMNDEEARREERSEEEEEEQRRRSAENCAASRHDGSGCWGDSCVALSHYWCRCCVSQSVSGGGSHSVHRDATSREPLLLARRGERAERRRLWRETILWQGCCCRLSACSVVVAPLSLHRPVRWVRRGRLRRASEEKREASCEFVVPAADLRKPPINRPCVRQRLHTHCWCDDKTDDGWTPCRGGEAKRATAPNDAAAQSARRRPLPPALTPFLRQQPRAPHHLSVLLSPGKFSLCAD